MQSRLSSGSRDAGSAGGLLGNLESDELGRVTSCFHRPPGAISLTTLLSGRLRSARIRVVVWTPHHHCVHPSFCPSHGGAGSTCLGLGRGTRSAEVHVHQPAREMQSWKTDKCLVCGPRRVEHVCGGGHVSWLFPAQRALCSSSPKSVYRQIPRVHLQGAWIDGQDFFCCFFFVLHAADVASIACRECECLPARDNGLVPISHPVRRRGAGDGARDR
jgi:hypothetical protein